MSRSKEYAIWCDMRRRCNEPHREDYKYYGGRGIKVCEQWANNFSTFLNDMGRCPEGHTLERKDNNDDYKPSNCKWASRAEQTINRRVQKNEIVLTFNGRTLTLNQWAKQLDIKPTTLHKRLQYGWPTDRILSRPISRNRYVL